MVQIADTSGAKLNTAVAAGGLEYIITAQPTKYTNTWNRLIIQNSDVVQIRVYLDGNTARAFDVGPNNGSLVLEPKDGYRFGTVQVKNLDAAVAETAGKIVATADLVVDG